MNIQEFKEMWVGRTFQCRDTGATFTIPEDVLPKNFYSIGEGYIDVGDGHYSRGGGNIVEILTEEIL